MIGYAEIKGCPLFRQIWAFIATTTTSITCVAAKCLQIIDILVFFNFQNVYY